MSGWSSQTPRQAKARWSGPMRGRVMRQPLSPRSPTSRWMARREKGKQSRRPSRRTRGKGRTSQMAKRSSRPKRRTSWRKPPPAGKYDALLKLNSYRARAGSFLLIFSFLSRSLSLSLSTHAACVHVCSTCIYTHIYIYIRL